MSTEEKQIEFSILTYLTINGIFAFKVDNMGVYDPKIKRFRPRCGGGKHRVLGIPDIFICLNVANVGVFVAFEVKSKKGIQSDNQKEFQKNFESKGGLYYVIRSIADAKKALEHARTKALSNMSKNIQCEKESYGDTEDMFA